MAGVAELYGLQKIDIMLARIGRRLRTIRDLIGDSPEVQQAREELGATEAELHTWQAKQMDAELESQSLKTRIEDSERRLMGGAVTNPKELEALQASVEALGRQRMAVEDHGVEALLMVEELTTSLAEKQRVLAAAQTNWETEQADLIAEETKLKRNYLVLKKQRAQLVHTLDQSLLKRYDTIRSRKGGVAVAELKGNNCSACNVTVPTGVASSARNPESRSLTLCPSCGRILYAG